MRALSPLLALSAAVASAALVASPTGSGVAQIRARRPALPLARCHPPLAVVRGVGEGRPVLANARCQPPCAVVRGVGEGRELPSPSGINAQPLPAQAAVVVAIAAAIGGLTLLLHGPGFDLVRDTLVWGWSRPTWPLLGLIYFAAGIAHFTELEGFENITPPNGTWGFWYTPFSTRFNVIWTGVVEILAGAGLLLSWLLPLLGAAAPEAMTSLGSFSALALALLTIAVTPANIYALTHGANFPLDLETPPKAHAVRLVFQAVLLAMLWEMS